MEVGSILFYRLLFGISSILVYIALIGRLNELRLGKKKRYMLLIGILNTVTMFSYFSAIKSAGVSVAVLLLYTAPLYVTLLSPLILKERVTIRSIFALTFSVSGIVLVVNPGDLGGLAGGNSSYLPGILFGMLSGLSYGCSIMTVNYLREEYSGICQMFWSTLVSLVLLLPFGISVSASVLVENLDTLIPFGITVTGMAYLLYMSGIVHIRAQTASVMALLEPVSCIFFGCTFLGEPLNANTIEGCILVLIGALLVSCKLPIKSKNVFGFLEGFPEIFRPRTPPRPGKL